MSNTITEPFCGVPDELDKDIMMYCQHGAYIKGKCRKRWVGAVIVATVDGVLNWEPELTTIATNNTPRSNDWSVGSGGKLECDSGCQCGKTLHAEMLAIHQFKEEWCGRLWKEDYTRLEPTLYTTHFPCQKCTTELIKFGVKHIVIASSEPNEPSDLEFLLKAVERGDVDVRWVVE